MIGHVSSRHVLVGLVAAALAGCSRELTTVQGQLVMNGQPYRLATNEQVLLTFETIAGQAEQSFSARVKSDGTFTVIGSEGAGIPPGKYRITIRSMRYGPSEEPSSGDKIGQVFSGPESPLTCDIGKREARITIDLGEKTVTGG